MRGIGVPGDHLIIHGNASLGSYWLVMFALIAYVLPFHLSLFDSTIAELASAAML
jgi:hypothetical protein